MPWFTSKAVGQRLARRLIISRQWRRCGYSRTNAELGNLIPIRGLSSIAGINSFPSSAHKFGNMCNHSCSYNNSNYYQRRGFLGCGDGEEGGVLSKVHEERRILG